MIKAVIFDVDGVLLDSFEANLKFFQDLMIAGGYQPPTREEFPSLFHLTMKGIIQKLTGSNVEEEIMRIFKLGESRDEVPYPIELLSMPTDADKTIEELYKNYHLGIVTSRIRNSVYEAPNLAMLKNFFKVVVSYEDTENHKPHPDPLLLAAKKLGIAPEESIYIGDTESDIKAARSAGMKIIHFSKDNIGEPDMRTWRFEEIPSLVEKLKI